MANIEALPSGFRFNALETVDTAFSRVLVKNLFKDQTFRPGITFTDKYNERAGQIYARRLGKISVAVQSATSANGLRLVHTNTADSLVLIQKNDHISVSEENFDLVEQLRASGKAADKMVEVTEAFAEKVQMQYMGYLLQAPATTGQVGVGGAMTTVDSGGDTLATTAALVSSVLAAREQIRVNGGTADTLIISPSMETLLLANALTPGNAFIPETNEEWLRTGNIGRLYGMRVYSSNLLGDGTPLEIPVAGNALPNTGNPALTDFVIYDHDAFAICGDINGARMINALDFFGSYAQIEGVFGGGVVNPALAYARVNAAVVPPVGGG